MKSFYSGRTDFRVPADKGGMPVQTDLFLRRENREGPLHLNPEIIKLAYAEYAAQGHGSQSLETLNRRSGFSVGEVIMLLADAIERHVENAHGGELAE